MKKLVFSLLFLSSFCLIAEDNLVEIINLNKLEKLSGEQLKAELSLQLAKDHRPITYKEAGNYIFTQIDRNNGLLCGVYSPEECIDSPEIPEHKVMNIEHTWPQSAGANGIAKSDLHHLFITSSNTNSIRSNLPFCDVDKVRWENHSSKRGFSVYQEHCFEPPQGHKGNVARAVFYFSLRYKMKIDKNQESFLRKWHEEDPVDQLERERETKIANIQNNRNLFIIYPHLVDLIQDF